MRRVLIFLYGTAVYLLFLATFLYAIGFVMDVAVPRSIEGALSTGLGTAVFLNVALLGLFGVQHSIMARPGFKRRWTRIIPQAAERSTFVLVTCLILTALFVYWQPIPTTVWRVENELAALLLHALAWSGWGMVLLSTFLIDHFALFGLRQVITQLRGRPMPHAPFQVRSLYRVVRHPLMLGFFIAFWSTPHMSAGRLLFAGVVTVWVLLTLQLEERDLVAEHGESYREYRAQVPMLVPRLLRPVAPAVRAASVEHVS
jgi:methanethiol S-methyltransferase